MLARFKWTSLPDAKITTYTSESVAGSITSHIFYHIQIKEGTKSWTVKKRYSEFKALHEELVEIFKDTVAVIPILPIGSVNPIAPSSESIKARQSALQIYIKGILRRGPLLHTTQVRTFLQPNESIVSALRGRESELDSRQVDFVLPAPSSDLIIPEHLRLSKGKKEDPEKRPSLDDDDFEMIGDDADSDLEGGPAIDVADDIIEDEIEKINIRERELSMTLDHPPPRRQGGKSRRNQRSDSVDRVSIELAPMASSPPIRSPIEATDNTQAASSQEQKPMEPLESSPADELIHLLTLIESVREKMDFFSSYCIAHSSSAESAYFVYSQTHRAFSSNLHTLKHERKLLLQLARALEHAVLGKALQPPVKRREAMQDLLQDPLSDGDDDPAAPSPTAAKQSQPEYNWMEPATLSLYLADCAHVVTQAIDWASKFVEQSEQAALQMAEHMTHVDGLVASAEALIHDWMDGQQDDSKKTAISKIFEDITKQLNEFKPAQADIGGSDTAGSESTASAAAPQTPRATAQLVEKLQQAREFLLSTCSDILDKNGDRNVE